MPAVTVELRKADPGLMAELAEFVVSRGMGPASACPTILVESSTECDAVAAALAEFVASHPGSYEMVVDGPEETSEIFKLHTANDTDAIFDAVAASSGFL